MEEVRPTRSELLERRGRIALARQGRDLLKQKRDALLIEFMKVMDDTLEQSSRLTEATATARRRLAIATAVDGRVAVRSAGLATSGHVAVEMSGTRVMGVPIPVVTKGHSAVRTSFSRGYSITSVSSRIDETAEAYEALVDAVVRYADTETRLKRLGAEIGKTNRRVNALEQVMLPALQEQVGHISRTLDERAREDLFRLKKVKRKIERRKKDAERTAGGSD